MTRTTNSPRRIRPWLYWLFVFSLLAGLAGAPWAGAEAGGSDSGVILTYDILFNGTTAPEEGTIVVECDTTAARVQHTPAEPLAPEASRETGYVDFIARRIIQVAEFRNKTACSVTTPFSDLPVFEMSGDSAQILGFSCRKATTVIRSNQIEVWFTRESPLRGSPVLNLIAPDGLVLRVVRNGNYEIVATHLAPGSPAAGLLPKDLGDPVDAAEYRARLAASWVTTVPVFRNEQICFDPAAIDTAAMSAALRAGMLADTTAVLRLSSGTVLLRKVLLPRITDAMVFAEVTEASNGDAYDRTGSVFLVPVDRSRSFLDGFLGGVGALPPTTDREGRIYQGICATTDYAPPLELVRFITPFGVGFYNRQVAVKGMVWADSVTYTMDVSELLPVLQGPVWVGAFVGNYDRGGHRVSLTLRYHPGSREMTGEHVPEGWVQPAFNTVNLLEMSGQEYGRIFAGDSLAVEIDVPPGMGNVRLRYITTGHGGWENGDEFNPRMNTILLDGHEVGTITPWRSDCASFRRFNPASGNFWNGISSSDLSRSGWCPGAAAEPITIPLLALAPGRHRIQVSIPMGAPEGDSFSAWNISGVLIGDPICPLSSEE